MANNIFANTRNEVIARGTVSVSSIFNVSNLKRAHELYNGVYKTYVPGGSNNEFNEFIIDREYVIISTIDMDLTDYFIPPISVLDTAIYFTGSAQQSVSRVTATVLNENSAMQFHFDSIQSPVGGPNTMEISVMGTLKMIVDFPDEYLGKNFKFVDDTSIAYFGTFSLEINL